MASVLPICFSLIGCDGNGGEDKPQANLFYAYATENLMADLDYLDPNPAYADENAKFIARDHTLRFKCIKGENEGIQLMIAANKYINEFDLELPDVFNGEKKIGKENFTAAAAWYQDVEGSNEKDSYTGFYPDALIPLENYKWKRRNYIEKNTNQSIYVNLVSTKDMEAGTYKGTGKLTLDGQEYDIPFEVTIYDAVLPEESHQQSCILIWYDQIVNGEMKNDTPELEKKYYDFLVSKHVSPDQLPPMYENSPETFANSMYEYIANNPRISTHRIPLTATGFTKERAKNYLQALINKNKDLRSQGDNTTDLFKKLIFYIDDEPSTERFETVKQHDKDIFDLKVELGPQLSAYPDLYESFTHINNLVTTPINNMLIATNEEGGVQTWCPQFQHFNSQANRDKYRERQASTDRDFGENVWWYGCMDPKGDYPSYHLDSPVIKSRVIPYMEYDYNIEGQVYWNICYYSKYSKGFTGTRDIWNDPITWENCAGDGALVYPGVTWGVDGPITTLRLEGISAGHEEYEYLWMIDQKVQEYDSSLNTNELLQKFYTRLFKNVIISLDTENFEVVREELLNVLETIEKDPEAGVKLLQK